MVVFKISKMENLLQELKCKQCEKVLSVFPIYYSSATGNICGRCSPSLDWMISNGTVERAVAYEAVAKYLSFPCCNKQNGCNAQLRWNQVEEHENSCNQKAFSCPLNGMVLQCNWKGNLALLSAHVHADHTNEIQQNPLSFVMNIEKDTKQVIPVVINEKLFMVETLFLKETNKFGCVVLSCNENPENQFHRYQLELGKYNDYFLILRKNNCEAFEELNNLFDIKDKIITVDVAAVSSMVGNANDGIHCKIGIAKKNKNEISAIMKELNPALEEATSEPDLSKIPPAILRNKPSGSAQPPPPPLPTKSAPPPLPKKNIPPLFKPKEKKSVPEKPKMVKKGPAVDKQLLEELECPICKEYMVPPIYICPTGHSICSNCKEKMKTCGFCQEKIKDTRNFTLENLTTRVSYPCKYAELGCEEVLTYLMIRQHELTCNQGTSKCPLKMVPYGCNIKIAPANIIDHIRENHAGNVIETNQVYPRNIKSKITSSYDLVIQDRELFIFCCKHSSTSGPIKFNLVHIGMKKNQAKFRYEMEFIDQINKGMKFIITQFCHALPPSISSVLKNECLSIPLELLHPFIRKGNSTLFYKLSITKL